MGSHQLELVAVHNDVGLLNNDGRLSNSRSRGLVVGVAAVGSGGTGAANPDHVPDTTFTAADVGVSGEPLLLGAGGDLAGNLHVGHEAARCVTSSTTVVVLEEIQVTIDLDSSERGSLGNSPDHAALSGDSSHVLSTAPEVGESATGEIEVTILAHEVAKSSVSGGSAETVHSSVVADLDVQVVLAGCEHEGVSAFAPLAVPSGNVTTVLSQDSVDSGLGGAVVGLEDVDLLGVPSGRVRLGSQGNGSDHSANELVHI